ncbi:MAG TPA: Uma2 family endonuclease, partial [Caldilineaceae bacterium]|nr:Uma2 family endonuclease [Caldilineaceae bacterium]
EQLLRLMTYEEFLEWGLQEGIRAEWVDGKVFLMSPNSPRHQRLMKFLLFLLDPYVQTNDLGEVFLAPLQMRLNVPPRGREPDLLFVAKEHLDRVRATHLDGPADLAVEIVSPESSGRDRETKLREYEIAGVPEYWIIDPEREEALFYQHLEGRYQLVLGGRNGRYLSAILPGFWLEVEWLWQEPLPRIDAIRQQSRA